MNQNTFFVDSFKGAGQVYMHVVVDTWCSYAFGCMHLSKQTEGAVAVLHNDVLPFYQKHKLIVENILTDNGRGVLRYRSASV
ncbi:transposase family protein [Prosthecochloris vibrioformis]|uniref:Transposase family protein n=1 Tax=Prosthecochloris vibrioformis TaxID=1098 RepID=A0A5C4RT70_PROVB|nr:transposase family protein [Prosthecochloris vibrioformis]